MTKDIVGWSVAWLMYFDRLGSSQPYGLLDPSGDFVLREIVIFYRLNAEILHPLHGRYTGVYYMLDIQSNMGPSWSTLGLIGFKILENVKCFEFPLMPPI